MGAVLAKRWGWRKEFSELQVYPIGTKEYLQIELSEDTPAPESIAFSIYNKLSGDQIVTDDAGTYDAAPHKCLCMVDMTGWDKSVYQLYLTLTLDTETPRLGPYEFIVN